MALKPRYKRRFFWGTLYVLGALLLAMVIVPPMITLNSFRPFLEKAILEQTQVPAKLNGNIHFSLVGGATIVAHDVEVPTAKIGSVLLSVPFHNLFDLKNATLDRTVVVYDADISVDKLAPAAFNHNIEIYDSDIDFAGNKFHIINAEFSDGRFNGIIRAGGHKYDVEFIGDTFHIRNKNNDIDITGKMFEDGMVRGYLSLKTDNLKKWLNIDGIEGASDGPIELSMNFEWDGGDGYKFTNISANNFAGSLEIYPNGDKDIQLVSENLKFDFSFLLKPNAYLTRTNINMDLYGELKLADYVFEHLKIQAVGTRDKFQIANVVADNTAITGGFIDKNGAHNVLINTQIDGINFMCLASGVPDKWQCSKFAYADMTGSFSVDNGVFDIFVQSDKTMPDLAQFSDLIAKLGRRGVIHFEFSDMAGQYKITDNGVVPSYTFVRGRPMRWLKIGLPFLPDYMKNATGDFVWENSMMTFTPNDKKWQLSMYDNYFYLAGDSFKSWFPNLDLRAIRDAKYSVAGFYNAGNISNLIVKIGNQEFVGSVAGKNITLKTRELNIDEIVSQGFLDNYEQLEFLTNVPILIPFGLPVNVSLVADALVYDGAVFNNFVYSLKPDVQTFSITDASRGNLLATIEKNQISYDVFMQLNKFVISGNLLSQNMPLNVRDAMITAEINMTTSGQIAHDIFYNMAGDMDIVFNGGYLIGMSFDDFYASAENITTLNAEYALARALEGGETKIKSMRVVGYYDDGNFITTQPIELAMRHTDAVGGLAITDGMMTAEFDLTMRGTAPTPATIALSILPDGGRNYSLSEIMQDIDTGFMRAFVKTHSQF